LFSKDQALLSFALDLVSCASPNSQVKIESLHVKFDLFLLADQN